MEVEEAPTGVTDVPALEERQEDDEAANAVMAKDVKVDLHAAMDTSARWMHMSSTSMGSSRETEQEFREPYSLSSVE